MKILIFLPCAKAMCAGFSKLFLGQENPEANYLVFRVTIRTLLNCTN